MANKHALCIGINDYPGTDSDLHGCVNDAHDWSVLLSRHGFGCELLLESDASGENVRAALKRLAAEARRGDAVVVTFSGHGSFVPDDNGDEDDAFDECWCPHDVVENGPIADDELQRIFSARKSHVRWVVISDSCHSGTVADFAPITTPATIRATDAPQSLVRFLPPGLFCDVGEDGLRKGAASPAARRARRDRRDCLLLSGCQDHEYSYDAWFDGRPNGAFTFVALRELANLGAKGTYRDWHAKICDALPSRQYPQTPNLSGPERMRKWIAFARGGETARRRTPAPAAPTAPRQPGPVPDRFVRDARARGRELASQALERGRARRPRTRGRTRTPLVAEGDSWFDFPWSDVLSALEDNHRYEITSVARHGHTLEHMAYSVGQLGEFRRALQKMKDRDKPPRAVLLSGGGNDVVGDEFGQLINHKLSPNPGLNERVVEGILYDRLWPGFETLISAVDGICEAVLGEPLPVLIHGYAYAVPDGRGLWELGWLLPGPWLLPGFEAKGYTPDVDREEMQRIVDDLIDRLNAMQRDLVARRGDNRVRHVDLRKTLPRTGDHTDWWQDELHPTSDGFDRIAGEFHKAIRAASRQSTGAQAAPSSPGR